MQTEAFNDLLQGPLCHPLPSMTIMRLVLALKFVVDECGDNGEAALMRWCQARESADMGEED
jgi:hypothetical protein